MSTYSDLVVSPAGIRIRPLLNDAVPQWMHTE